MKIVYNIYVAVRKLWNAIFGKNGDGSSVELIKGNPTVTAEAPNLTSVEINGTKYKIELSAEQVQEAVNTYLSGDPSVFQDVVAPLIAPEWDNTVAYKVGDLFTYDGKQYYTIKDATAGTLPTNTEFFEEKSVADLVEMLKNGSIQVGYAKESDNLKTKVGVTDTTPYLYRTTAGALESGSVSRLKKIIGASVPIIQLVNPTTNDSDGGVYLTAESDGSVKLNGTAPRTVYLTVQANIPLVAGHKYILMTNKSISGVSIGFESVGYSASRNQFVAIATSTTTRIRFKVEEGTVLSNVYVFVNMIEVTQTFGTTVANRLYALEQANTGTGISKLKEILVQDYYPYNVTNFTNVKTSGKTNTGFNQLNLSKWLTDQGFSDISAISNGVLGGKILWQNDVKYNGIVCLSHKGITRNNTDAFVAFRFVYTDGTNSIQYTGAWLLHGTGYITSTEGKTVSYIDFVHSSGGSQNFTNAEITIDLDYDGERSGELVPYVEWNYPCSDTELKGIAYLDASDNWVYNGDEYHNDGTIDNNYMEYTCSANEDLTAYSNPGGTGNMFALNITGSPEASISSLSDVFLRATKFTPTPWNNVSASSTMVICQAFAGKIYVKVSESATADETKTALEGVKIVFKKKTQTQSSADQYPELQDISNWGTEKWNTTGDVVIPVGSECFYPLDLKAMIEVMPKSPDADGTYVMTRENGTNSYSSISTWLADNGYVKPTAITGYDDTKTQTLKNVEGTLTWVDDE